MTAVDEPVRKSDLDAAVEQLRTEMGSRFEAFEHRFDAFEARVREGLVGMERDIIRHINRYFAALTIALISALAAGATAVILGG